MRDEITRLAPGPVFIMYERVYPRDAWCPFLPEKWGEAWFLSAAGRGVSEVRGRREWEAPLRSGGLVHVRCGLPGWCAGSQSGSASDKLPMEVSCADGEAEQKREERVAQHTCPRR